MTKLPIPNPPANLRQRFRADGTVRIWWEPSSAARRLGFDAVELDEKRLTWSVREATRLNRDLEKAKRDGRRAAPAPMGRTIDALIDRYTRSDRFRRLAAKTQDSYRKQFSLVSQKWGLFQAIEFSKPVMHEWYETLLGATGPATASARLRHMSILMAYAELIGWRAEGSNPCARLGMRVPKGRRRIISWAEYDALIAAAEAIGQHGIATAIALGLYQGQRQTDLRLATIGAFSHQTVQLMGWPEPRAAWVWQLTRSKRGNTGAMIVHDEAAPRLERAISLARARALKDGQLRADEFASAPLLWDHTADLPFTGRGAEDRFQNRWASVKAAAIAEATARAEDALATSLAEVQFRDLRRSFGALSRAGGASKDDTADVLGNSAATDQLLADIYMAPSFETASRAVASVRRPEPQERKKA